MDDGGSNLLNGIIIGELLSSNPERSHSYDTPSSTPDTSISPGGGDFGGGGASGSWDSSSSDGSSSVGSDGS